jgi:hypothetical protein
MVLIADASSALAQTPSGRRGVAFANVGAARTADDEGLLGTGVAVSAGAGLRVTPRLTLQVVFDRIPYRRDAEYLVFDGRVLFAGVEAAFRSTRARVRPYAAIGAGMMHDAKRWTHRRQIGPGQYLVDEVTDHEFMRTTVRASGGMDVSLSEALSIRAGLTFHGLLDTGDDLAAHVILQPVVGIAWAW